jgi:hypothetical protein
LRRSNPVFDFSKAYNCQHVNVKDWIASSQKALLATTIPRATTHHKAPIYHQLIPRIPPIPQLLYFNTKKKQNKECVMKKLITLQICAFIFLFSATLTARAEYYMVYPGTVYYTGYTGCPSCYTRCHSCQARCTSCCRSHCGGYRVYYETPVYYEVPRVVYMRYVSPRRHVYRGSEESVEYGWVPYP